MPNSSVCVCGERDDFFVTNLCFIFLELVIFVGNEEEQMHKLEIE
jgi:hypothetical protein